MTIWFVLLSAGIKTSAFQMSKFRGSITLSIFSLSTLSNYHYWQSPKTRYWRLVRPYQTGIPPARLLALIWAHNSDFPADPQSDRARHFGRAACSGRTASHRAGTGRGDRYQLHDRQQSLHPLKTGGLHLHRPQKRCPRAAGI